MPGCCRRASSSARKRRSRRPRKAAEASCRSSWMLLRSGAALVPDRAQAGKPYEERAREMTDDERAIRELVATWMTASEAGNIDTVLGLMTDDVLFMIPGREPFGKEAFAAASRSMAGVRMQGSNDLRELVVL